MSERGDDAVERGDDDNSKELRHSEVEKERWSVGQDGVRRAEHADSYRYRMDYPNKGTCVIINNKNFLPQTGMNMRKGTDLDAEAAMETFSHLGYKTRRFDDQRVGDMERLLYNVSQEDHSDSASFVCVLLSHGGDGDVFFGIDGRLMIETLTRNFRGDCCRTLVAKPKLFFIQACRGEALDDGIQTDSSSDQSSYKIPLEADFLYAFSTAPGYLSWRSTNSGSWFIQSLCEMLKKHSRELELMRIMTRVHHKVALEFESVTNKPETHSKKQMPCIWFMLTKEFYFH